MHTSYVGLFAGLGFSIVLVYMLIVVNFQSWLDPFIIITALPAALCGIILFLFFTRTTLSVPALTGSIMCVGVATANSILVISFARERLSHHGDPALAAVESGFTRFRPVLMTALAMIIGMVPMALGLGDGGEENAPLGRAVIGGLMCATRRHSIFRSGSLQSAASKKAFGPTRGARRQMIINTEPTSTPSRTGRSLRHGLTVVLAAAVLFELGLANLLRHPDARGGCDQVAADYRAVGDPGGGCHPSTERRSHSGSGLAGSTQAFVDSPIYARTSGYLKRWYFDIGARVKQGDLLAEIETPEIDQQLRQARADLDTAKANQDLAQTTADRWQFLLTSGSVSKQETDQAVSNLRAQKAAVEANSANVHRLEDLQSFEKVYAPFDGVITARSTDIGALINAGAGTPAQELFHMASIAKLRLFVAVPEVYSRAAQNGAKASLTLDEFPGETFTGTLVCGTFSWRAARRDFRSRR